MPVHGADDREKNMETGLAVLFGVCCSVTDCKRRKITLSVLLAGAAAGCILSGIRIWQGTESAWEMFAAILPAVCLESVVILTAGKVGAETRECCWYSGCCWGGKHAFQFCAWAVC